MALQTSSIQYRKMLIAILFFSSILFLLVKKGEYTCLLNKGEKEFISMIRDTNPYWKQVKGDFEDAKQFLNKFDLSAESVTNFKCLNMSTAPPTPVCIHSVSIDVYLSVKLIKLKTWERKALKEFQIDLQQNPSFGFIDLGANIGVYTLLAANMGRTVVAVEPYHENIVRLQHASKLAGTTNRILLLQNGVSETRGDAQLKLSRNNQGDTRINMNSIPCTSNCPPRIKTILLSDLRYVVSFKQAIMKIDIQGFEQAAFTTFESLLQTVFIYSIYMEWELMKKFKENPKQDAKILHMIGMLNNHGYKPYATKEFGGKLMTNSTNYPSWTFDIVWRFKGHE